MILLPVESLSRQEAESHGSLCRKPFFVDGSLSRKSRTVSAEAKYDGQSLSQDAEIEKGPIFRV